MPFQFILYGGKRRRIQPKSIIKHYMIQKEEVPLLRIVHIQHPAALQETCELLTSQAEIAIDLEFDDMNFAYGRHLSLVQVWAGDTAYLIDAMQLPDIDPLIRVLENERITKIFHSCRNDLLLLSELYDVRIRNVMDTSIMFRLLGEADNDISLKDVVRLKLQIELQKGEQTSNWLLRPLTESQCLYAANDVAFLIPLKDLLLEQLRQANRLGWLQEECTSLECLRYQVDEEQYLRIGKKYRLEAYQLPLLQEIWHFRDRLARKLNKPSYWVFSNETLSKLASNPPQTLETWKQVKGLHAVVKQPVHLQELLMLSGNRSKEPVPVKENPSPRPALPRVGRKTKHRTREARKQLLAALKPVVAEKHGQPIANFFMTNRRCEEIIELGTEKSLSQWQKTILMECCQTHSLDYRIIQ